MNNSIDLAQVLARLLAAGPSTATCRGQELSAKIMNGLLIMSNDLKDDIGEQTDITASKLLSQAGFPRG